MQEIPESSASENPTPHKRRVRYAGKHPRNFSEKYKELNPERYQEDIQKVKARGQTPAGSHIPICVSEILQILNPCPGQWGLDATLGFGGHTQRILECMAPKGHLTSLDVDTIELPKTEARLRTLGYDEQQWTARRMNFAGIKKIVAESGRPFDFVLADLGVSSMQIDNPDRGFSYKIDGPLDLRLNPSRGMSAAEYLRSIKNSKLQEILVSHSDEIHAIAIAKEIELHFASGSPIETTRALRDVIAKALDHLPAATQKDEIRKSCQRTFQALRIAVNDEFVVLDQLLESLPLCLAPGGRVAILTFHSGEDRRVKKSFQHYFRTGVYQSVAPDPIRPSAEEQRENPRSSSAKLRWAILAS